MKYCTGTVLHIPVLWSFSRQRVDRLLRWKCRQRNATDWRVKLCFSAWLCMSAGVQPRVYLWVCKCALYMIFFCIFSFGLIHGFEHMCARACRGKRKASRFHSQSGSISSGRPQSQTPRVRLPTVGMSRDDCPRWGFAHAHSQSGLHMPKHIQICT